MMVEPVKDYDLRAFFAFVVEVLDRLDIPYMVVGGFAAIVLGEPRFTIDVDIVADMKQKHVRAFVAAFPIPNYYASEEGIRDSLQRRYPFNVIHTSTGAKIDLVPLPNDPFTRAAFHRRQRLEYDEAGRSAFFTTAEDIVLAKLIAFRETTSEKHLRDARGVLITQWGTLDLEAMRRAARAAGVLERFEELLDAANREGEE
jgi:hypothetical protein